LRGQLFMQIKVPVKRVNSHTSHNALNMFTTHYELMYAPFTG
jgi:hypothetical protein